MLNFALCNDSSSNWILILLIIMTLRGHITGGFCSSRKRKLQQQLAKGVNIRYLHKYIEIFWALSLTQQPKPNCLSERKGCAFLFRGSLQIIAALYKEKKKDKPLNSTYAILTRKKKGGRERKVGGLYFADALHSLAKDLERSSQPLIPLGKEAVI